MNAWPSRMEGSTRGILSRERNMAIFRTRKNRRTPLRRTPGSASTSRALNASFWRAVAGAGPPERAVSRKNFGSASLLPACSLLTLKFGGCSSARDLEQGTASSTSVPPTGEWASWSRSAFRKRSSLATNTRANAWKKARARSLDFRARETRERACCTPILLQQILFCRKRPFTSSMTLATPKRTKRRFMICGEHARAASTRSF